ncbi:TPA: HlyD family efflux transporter periplasmic adaptor subunit [Legionella pneumophila]|nr:HlyD family efflux transporter periplasmic adaptor subunit [Legionella pneumophila]HAT8182933.1 HlyD family efflux transporter periplasmic adaptor subunit [Legionella pneumophila]
MRIGISILVLLVCCTLQSCKKEKSPYQTTSYVESQSFIVSSPDGGYIKEWYVNEGQLLHKEDRILTFDGINSIKAPADSIMTECYYLKDEYVPPNFPIASLSLPSQMKILFYVPESHLDKIKLGKTVQILLNEKKYLGKVSFISNQAEYTPDALFSEKNRYKLVYKVKADPSYELRGVLKIGQPVEVNYE